jgi:hypothetical protein
MHFMKSITDKYMKTMIHLFGRKRQKMIAALFMFVIALGALPSEVKAQVTTVDITSTTIPNPYVIAPGSGNYIIKGQGTQTANRINVKNGYHGTITLDNVNIVCPVDWAPMRLFGTYNGDNNNPTTKVKLILKGNNYLNSGNGANSVAAGLQVDQGAQVDISAIDPENNASGYLKADTRNTDMSIAGAAGIGGPCVQNTDGDGGPNGIFTGTYIKYGTTPTTATNRFTTGGNIVITSGTVVAQGGNCGAGIGGGGWEGLYLGNIVITGGNVTATGGVHSPGIGGGCDQGGGNNGTYVPGTCVIAVPPAKINASTPSGGKGLSGAETIVYIGDPQSPQFTVHTEDYRATTMYLDLSGDPKVKAKLQQFAPTRDPERMYLGESRVYPADGLTLWNTEFAGKNIIQNYGTFTGNITFFTDAKNEKGFEYVPETRTMTPNIKVQLNAPVYEPVMTMKKYVPAIGAVAPMDTADLLLGYTDVEATTKAVTLTFRNNGNTKLYNLQIDLVAPYHTAEDGTSLDAKIQNRLMSELTLDVTSGEYYLAPGVQFQVKARLKPGLGVGTYTGAVRFNADNVPSFVTKSQSFPVNVVRILLPPPTLDTAPSGMNETNAPFVVEATFVRPVSGVTDGDIQSTGGTVSGMTPVGAAPTDKWRFIASPKPTLANGQYIQLFAKENIAADDHGISTDDRSNALSVRYNTDKPYTTFHFAYDIAADSVFVAPQNSFTFTVKANGGSGADIDSLWSGASYMNASLAVPAVTILKDGSTYTGWNVTAYEWDAAAGAHVITVTGTPSVFGEGDYKITLAGGIIRNNVGNTMDEKTGGFKVRIPVIEPGTGYPGAGIGYGIEPSPVSLPYKGGNVLLTVHGKNLQYAEALGILKIQMPAAILNGIQVAPHAAADGRTATVTVPAPGNSTVTPVSHAFTLLLNGAMPDPDAIGYTTVNAAPAIVIAPVTDKWFGLCEYEFTATVPDDGADREVNLTYLGLAKDYLVMQGGVRPPSKVTLRGGETQLHLLLKTLRVPDNRESGTGAIVVSSPGLPCDTSVWFQFYNTPNVDNMVYIPPTKMYPGKLELNIRGGSPTLERSFNDVTWESAYNPVTPSQIANLEGIVYLREPDGCDEDMHFYIRGFFKDTVNNYPQIVREIQIPLMPNVITDPGAGAHHVNSGDDFIFTVTLTGIYSGMFPEVSTSRRLLSDREGVTIVPLGNDEYRVTIHVVREHFSIGVTATEADPGQGVEEIDVPRVWTSEGQVHIYATRSGEARIYTLTGALVKNLALVAGTTNSTSLNAGFYVVVTLNNGKRYKIVIQ